MEYSHQPTRTARQESKRIKEVNKGLWWKDRHWGLFPFFIQTAMHALCIERDASDLVQVQMEKIHSPRLNYEEEIPICVREVGKTFKKEGRL